MTGHTARMAQTADQDEEHTMAAASAPRPHPGQDDLSRNLAAVRASLQRHHGGSVASAQLDALVARFAEEFAWATVGDYLGVLIAALPAEPACRDGRPEQAVASRSPRPCRAGSPKERTVSHETLVELTRRTLAHGLAGTIPLAESIERVPARSYLDPDRWRGEMDAVFGRLPLVVGFSCELSEPHAYKALEVAGVPLLLSRGADGVVHGFVNSCSHRGAVVVPDGMGVARRHSCPYHGWTYDASGHLVGVVDRDQFGALDPACLGLTPLPVTERAGIVFAALRPGPPLEIDRFLCGYDAVLDEHRFAECTYVGSQSVEGPNWKVAYDGYLDFYHLPVLHRNTFGPKASNKAIYDGWGPHQRVSSPDKRTLALDGVPAAEWPHEVLTGGVWTIFPHTSIAGFPVRDAAGDGGLLYMMSTLYPGATPDTSVTVQTFLAAFEPTESLRAVIAAQQQFLLGVVRDEDYDTGRRLQRALEVGAKEHVLFGRNELGGQRFHRWVDAVLAATTDEELAKLFIDAEIHFQR